MADPQGIVSNLPDFQVDFSTERYSNIPESASPYYTGLQGHQSTDFNRPAYAPTPAPPGPFPVSPPYPVGPVYPAQPIAPQIPPPYPLGIPLQPPPLMDPAPSYPLEVHTNIANEQPQQDDYDPEPHQHFDEPIASPDNRDGGLDQGGNDSDRAPASPVNGENELAPLNESGEQEPVCEEAAVGTQTDDVAEDDVGVSEGGEHVEENDKSGEENPEDSSEKINDSTNETPEEVTEKTAEVQTEDNDPVEEGAEGVTETLDKSGEEGGEGTAETLDKSGGEGGEGAAENLDKSGEEGPGGNEADKDNHADKDDNVEKIAEETEKSPEEDAPQNEEATENPETNKDGSDEQEKTGEVAEQADGSDKSGEKEAESSEPPPGDAVEGGEGEKEAESSEPPPGDTVEGGEGAGESAQGTTNDGDGDSDDIIVTGEEQGRQKRRSAVQASERIVLGTMRSATINQTTNGHPDVVRVKQEPNPDGADYTSDGGPAYGSTGAWSQEDRQELSLEEMLEIWKNGPCPVYGCRASGNYNQLHQRIRHYERLHARFHVIFVCPVTPCGESTERFQGKDLMSMNKHLKGQDHNLTPNQIAALRGSIESQNVPNPDYLPPIYDQYCQVTYNQEEYSNVLGSSSIDTSNHNIQFEDLPSNTDQLYEDVSDLLHIPPEAVNVWRSSKKCPVTNCKGPALTLKHFFDWHWYVFHEQLIKIYYCPVKGCKRGKERWNTRRRRDLVSHLNQKHKVEKLPEAIETQIVKNPNYKPPVNFGDDDTSAATTNPESNDAAKSTPRGRKTRTKAAPVPSPTKAAEEAEDEAIPAEFEEVWQKLKACPVAGCPSHHSVKFKSEFKRHWKMKHVKTTALFVCPDGNCQMDLQGKKVQYRHKDMKSMLKHLTGSAHMLSQEEAVQIGEAIVPTQLDNPNYMEPVLAPPPAPKPASKPAPKPKVVKAPPKPKASPKPAAESPASGERRTRGRQSAVAASAESDSSSEVSSTSQGRTRSRLADYRLPAALSTPKNTKDTTPTRKRGRAREESPTEEPAPTKQAKMADESLVEDTDNFEASNDVIPPGFMEWWSNRDGCPSVGCNGAVCKFTIHDLVRHWKAYHIPVVPFYQCPKARCEYSSKVRKNLVSHLHHRHQMKGAAADGAKTFWQDNPEYAEPVLPTKKNSPVKASGRKPPKERGVPENTDSLQPIVELDRYKNGTTVNVTPQKASPSPAQTTRSGRSRVEVPMPQSGGRSTRGNPRPPSPIPEPSPSVSRSGKRRGRSEPQDDSLQEPAWQPKVCIVPLPIKYATSNVVNMTAIKNVNLSPITKNLPAPMKKLKMSPVKPISTPVMPTVTFEADDYDDDDNDNFGVEVPMPSMEDAGIAISVLPGRKGSPTKSGSKPTSPMPTGYPSELEFLKKKQLELERRLEQTTKPGIDGDVLKQISSLQAQNEALRFQNQALRSQLMSGEMAKQWADEKKKLEQQLINKDTTISTLQDVINRLSNQNSTNNNITNQMINLPGAEAMGRPQRAARITNPNQRLSITPRAGTSEDGTLQQCSVSLKSGASVNFQYDSFADFMQKIGTLNDQYSLND